MTDTADLARRSAHALGWSWAGALARAALQLAVQVLLARLLGPQAFGEAAAVLLVVGVAGLLAEAGLGAALVQRADLDEPAIAVALGWVLAVSSAVAGAIVLAAPWLAAALGDPRLATMLRAAALLVPLQALSALPVGLLQRGLLARRLQAIQLVAYLVAYGGCGLALAAGGAGAWAVLAAFGVHALVAGGLAAASVRMPWRARLSGAPALRAYGARITVSNLLNWGLESVDRLAVSRYWGLQPLGEYSVAATLARAPVGLLVGAAQPVAFASVARLQDEPARVARGAIAMLALAMLPTLPLFVWLASFAAPIVALLYGPAWAGAAAPFAWLCLAVPAFVVVALAGPMLRGVDAVGGESHAQLAVLVASIVLLALVLGRPLEVVAAAVAVLTLLRAVAIYWTLARRIGIARGAWLRALAAPLAWGALTVLLCHLVAPLPALAAMSISAALSLGVGLLALRLAAPALLCAELCQALRNRAGDSRLSRWVVQLLRL